MKEQYNKLAKKHGNDVKALHWPSVERQEAPFQAFMRHVDFQDSSVMDIGCGFGDFFQFMKRHNIDIKYYGFDISEKLIDMGKSKYPEVANRLQVLDATNATLPQTDYAVISGTFNLKTTDNWALITKTVANCFKSVNKAVLFNLISTYVDFQEPHLSYIAPEKIFAYAKTLSPFVDIINNYNPYEYMVAIFKESRNNQ